VYKLVTDMSVEYKICEKALMKLKLDHMIIQSGGLAKGNQVLGKSEYKNMIEFGLGQIMKVGNDHVENDIDKIIDNSFKIFNEDLGLKVKKLEEEFDINNLNVEGTNTYF